MRWRADKFWKHVIWLKPPKKEEDKPNKPKSKPLTKEEVKDKELEMKRDWAKMQKHALEAQKKAQAKNNSKTNDK